MLKILKISILFFSSFNFVNSFNTYYPINSFKIDNNILKSRCNNIIMLKNECPDYLIKYTKFLNADQGEFLVKKISGLFPKMDIISHYVLHTNDVLIEKVLNNEYLKMEAKKNIVLFLIEMTQKGDSTGSHILQIYHDIVKCLL